MEELHAAIADYLRSQRPDTAVAQGHSCRQCSSMIIPGSRLYHIDELRDAGMCAACYVKRTSDDIAPPRCTRCGLVIVAAASLFELRSAQALRMCFTCEAVTVAERSPSTHRALLCRMCGQEFDSGRGRFHMDELASAGRCADCYGYDARRSKTSLVLDWDRSTKKRQVHIAPLCKHCGTAIVDGGDFGYEIAKLHAERVCPNHYIPF